MYLACKDITGVSASGHHVLEFRNVSFSYNRGIPLIKDMAFAIENGEFIGLLGPNGSGKSTVLKLASGLLKTTTGEVKIWNKDIQSYRNQDRAKLLSYLPQILDMQVPFTVYELVSMGVYPYEIMPELTVDEAINMVGLTFKKGDLITNLSGGERRRVYIAMTLLQGTGLILFDEPFANLDIKFQIELLRLLKELREKRGLTVVMALHDINLALQFEKVVLIKEGMILKTGRPEEVLTRKLLKEAFDVDVDIKMDETGGAYIKY